jgi:hypothetical protein
VIVLIESHQLERNLALLAILANDDSPFLLLPAIPTPLPRRLCGFVDADSDVLNDVAVLARQELLDAVGWYRRTPDQVVVVRPAPPHTTAHAPPRYARVSVSASGHELTERKREIARARQHARRSTASTNGTCGSAGVVTCLVCKA